jgi:hypothetical protein
VQAVLGVVVQIAQVDQRRLVQADNDESRTVRRS